MKKQIIWPGIALIIVLSGYLLLTTTNTPKEIEISSDYKNIEYTIDGTVTKLHDGIAESDSNQKTSYFGNELQLDVNSDGRDDVVFLLTHTSGGSGTFFYAVAALNTAQGYTGSHGYLLGDRISPQSTHASTTADQKNIVVINYADRKPTDPMTETPSVGKSLYLQFNQETMRLESISP